MKKRHDRELDPDILAETGLANLRLTIGPSWHEEPKKYELLKVFNFSSQLTFLLFQAFLFLNQ